jgi:SAM-dependent methyltransferase
VDISLTPARRDAFNQAVPTLAPWMHPFKFGPRTYTGYFKYDGIEQTWVNETSPDADVERLRTAYDRYHAAEEWSPFLRSLLTDGLADVSRMTVLDIGAGSGRNSLLAAGSGCGLVTAVEIRANQSAQLQHILDAAEDPRYREHVRAVHEPLSADDPAFGARYESSADTALSLGLLYHLANPWQHLLNLRRIARRRAIVYTLTHQNPLAKQMWFMTPENAEWITKATSGISWTPHYLEVARLCRLAGFSRVTIRYAARFARHFAGFDRPGGRVRDLTQVASRLWWRATGHRIGAFRNHDFEYFRHTGLNPNYFAYVCDV